MRILLIHRYFWPDTPPYALMLRRIAATLAAQGHDVTVLAGQPSYKSNYALNNQPKTEFLDGFRIRRLNISAVPHSGFGRLINMSYFSVSLFLHIIINRYDAVMISTVPQVLGATAVGLSCKLKGTPFIYHCMDIQPEIAYCCGDIDNAIIYKLLRTLDAWVCRTARRVIVLSEDMRNSLVTRGVESSHIDIINNFELTPDSSDNKSLLPQELQKDADKFRVLFAGNIGRFQSLDKIICAAQRLNEHTDIEFVLMGDGKAVESLKKQAADCCPQMVRFVPHQSVEVARELMRDADLGIVSLASDVVRYAFPSKTMTYLCEGLPILGLVEKNSQLARTIEEFNLGKVACPDSPVDISNTILQLYKAPAMFGAMQENAQRYGKEHYSEYKVLPKWENFFGDLV